MERFSEYLERKSSEVSAAKIAYATALNVCSNVRHIKSQSDAEIRLCLNTDRSRGIGTSYRWGRDPVYDKLIRLPKDRDAYSDEALRQIEKMSLALAGKVSRRTMKEDECERMYRMSPEEIEAELAPAEERFLVG